MEFDGWDIFNLVVSVIFVACFLLLLYRHLRDPESSTLIGGGRLAATGWVVGLTAIVLASALPISEAVSDRVGLFGCLLMLGSLFGSKWSREDEKQDEPS